MLLDAPIISQGSMIINTVAESGAAYPTSTTPGEIFFRKDTNLFAFRNNTAWVNMALSSDLTTHINNNNVHLLPADRTFLSGLTVTFAQVNTIPTITSDLAATTASLNAHKADMNVHLTSDQNTFMDGLNLPTLKAAEVNFLIGTTSNVQTQFTNQTASTTAVNTALNTHKADQTVHVLPAQRTWLDGIDMAKITPAVINTLDTISAGGSAATKLPLAGGTMSGAIAMGANKITNLGTPTLDTDAATKKYVDVTVAAFVPDLSGYLKKAGDTMSGTLNMANNKVTGLATPTAVSDATSKTYVDSADNLKLNKAGDSMTGVLNMGTQKISGLGTPSLDTDAATKKYVDDKVVGITDYVRKTGDTMSGILTMGDNRITGVGAPTVASDATNKAYVDGQLATKLNLSGGTLTGSIDLSTFRITGVGGPISASDATTKGFVDGQILTRLPLAGGTMTGPINMGSNKITVTYSPTVSTDLVPKSYVDSASVASAAKLTTAQAINGTNFDGSGPITTSIWGTTRNFTVGATTKAVNGSAAMTWTLAEIGAAPTASPSFSGTSVFGPGTANNAYGCALQVRGDSATVFPALSLLQPSKWGVTIMSTSAGNLGFYDDTGNTPISLTVANVNGGQYYASGWFRSAGAVGWYNDTYAGGIYMIDATWVRVYNSKGFYVDNQIAATGNITAYYSDERLKTNKKRIKNALAAVESLTGYTYNANELAATFGYDPSKDEVGLMAQDVQAVIPQMVEQAPFDLTGTPGESKTGEHYLTLKYERMVPHLVEAIKELSGMVRTLQAELDELKSK